MLKLTSLLAAAALVAFVGATPASAGDKAGPLGGNCCSDLEERIAELEATVARKGNRKISLTITGNVSQAITWIEGQSEPTIGDNATDPSFVRLYGEARISPSLTVGYAIEVGIDTLDVRESAVNVGTVVGRVTLGRTSTATDGVVEATAVGNLATASRALNIDHLGFAAWTVDGGRADVVRYDSPVIGGFVASAAWSNDVVDVALRYSANLGDFRIVAAAGYREDDVAFGPKAKTLAGSASVLHAPTGLFVNAAAADVQSVPFVGADGRAYQVQGGISRDWTGLGATTLFGEWASYDVGPVQVDMVGGGLVQSIGPIDLFAHAQRFDDVVTVGRAGASIKF